MCSQAGAPLNRSSLYSYLKCWRYLEDSCLHSVFVQALKILLSHSSHLIQPVQSLFSSNLFNGVSLEWVLTHRYLPRILPDSSIFPELLLNSSPSFDVRMGYHQSNVFLQDFSHSFHRLFNLSNFHPGVSQRFMMVFLIVILNMWRPKKSFSSKSWSVLSKMRSSSLMPSSDNCFDCEYSFHISGAFHELFSFISSEGHLFKYYSFQLSALVIQILPVHHSSVL